MTTGYMDHSNHDDHTGDMDHPDDGHGGMSHPVSRCNRFMGNTAHIINARNLILHHEEVEL